VAVVLTLVQTKQIRVNIYKQNNAKNTVQTIQNTVNTSIHFTKTLVSLQVPAFNGPICEGIFTDICSLFPIPDFLIMIVPTHSMVLEVYPLSLCKPIPQCMP